MPDLTKNQDGSTSDLALNYRKTRETTNLGTRKIAFYTCLFFANSGLVATKNDSNGLYSQLVQTLQQAGAEIYWLGQPHNLNETFIRNYDYLNFYQRGDTNAPSAFVFAIPDDADSPITRPYDSENPYATLEATITNDYDPNWISFNGNFPSNDVYTGMPIVFSGTTFGGIVAGKTYYIKEHELDGPNLQLRLSETADSEVLDIQNPKEIGGEPGPLFELTNGSGSMTARIDWLDAIYQGTAGDYISGCCVDMTYPAAAAAGFINAIYTRFGSGMYWVERCAPSFGIFPAWWAN